MPPKAKFTREEIIAAALKITRERGIDALTARALGEMLGSSPRPVFTVFESMDEVQQCVVDAAKKEYAKYVDEGLNKPSAFKGVGEAYIRFAAENPKLFRLLFMSETKTVPKICEVLGVIENDYERILESVRACYNLPSDKAEKFYRHLWIYSHGIAVLLATKVCSFSGDEISAMLTEVATGVLKNI